MTETESILSYDDYELVITKLDSTYKGVCQELLFEDESDSLGQLASQFVISIQNKLLAKKKEKQISTILKYQREVWEKQDNLEMYLKGLNYSCYSYRVPDSQVSYRYAVSPEYRDAFQKNKNSVSDFPSWTVVRIF